MAIRIGSRNTFLSKQDKCYSEEVERGNALSKTLVRTGGIGRTSIDRITRVGNAFLLKIIKDISGSVTNTLGKAIDYLADGSDHTSRCSARIVVSTRKEFAGNTSRGVLVITVGNPRIGWMASRVGTSLFSDQSKQNNKPCEQIFH